MTTKKASKKKVSVKEKRSAPQSQEANAFTATLEVNEQKFSATNIDSEEAMHELANSIPREVLKTKAVLTLEQNGLSAQQLLYVIPLRRFLLNKVTRMIFAKRLRISLK